MLYYLVHLQGYSAELAEWPKKEEYGEYAKDADLLLFSFVSGDFFVFAKMKIERLQIRMLAHLLAQWNRKCLESI